MPLTYLHRQRIYGRTPSSLLTGLVAYWKFNESSGDAADSGPNGITLTNNGTTGYTTGKLGNGWTNNAAGTKFFSASHTAAQEQTNKLSFSMWLNLDATIPDHVTVFSKWVDSSSTKYFLDISNAYVPRFWIALTNTDAFTTRGQVPAISASTWTHVVWVYDGEGADNAARLKCWVNGSAQTVSFTGTIPASLASANPDILLGKRGGANQYLDGIQDEFGWWSKALTADEVASLYSSGNANTHPF